MTLYVGKLLALAIACWVAPLSAQQIAVSFNPVPAKSDCPYAKARQSHANSSEAAAIPVNRSRSETSLTGVSRPGEGLLP